LILLAVGGTQTLTLMHPLLYVAPTFATRGLLIKELAGTPQSVELALPLMVVWALPFIWIGVSMSFRRARNAGISPWTGLLFFVPLFNMLVIAILCTLPTRERDLKQQAPGRAVPEPSAILGHAIVAVCWSALFGVVLTALCVFVLDSYGAALFVGGPVVMGAIGGWRVNRHQWRGFRPAMLVGLISSLICGGLLIIFAMEGIVCLAMVAPLAIAGAVGGAVIGAALAQLGHGTGQSVSAMALMLPIVGAGDVVAPTALPAYSVTTDIIIDAPPAAVWPNVIGFSELPPPQDWLLNTGISCPLRARIEGEGVGAVRYCEFTTGPFVEPITVWDPPQRLGFDVVEQPAPMHEWSPYDVVFAPHLEGTMISQRGAFELIPLPGGGTQLKGTTWYTLDIAPAPYWRLWSDLVVHRIHTRVLRHIKNLSETG